MRKLAILLGLVFVAAGCANGDGSADVLDAGLSEIGALQDGTSVRVGGALFIAQDTRLCGSVAESYPPQCGEPSVELVGLDTDQVIGLTSPSDPTFAPVTWTDYPLTVIGDVAAGAVDVTRLDQPAFSSATTGPVTVRLGVNTPEGLMPGAAVWWSLELTNTTDEPILVTFADGQEADVVLVDEASGAAAYRWSDGMMFTQALREVEIGPGATDSAVLSGELDVDAGTYSIAGFFVAPQVADVVAAGTLDLSG